MDLIPLGKFHPSFILSGPLTVFDLPLAQQRISQGSSRRTATPGPRFGIQRWHGLNVKTLSFEPSCKFPPKIISC